MSIRAQDEPEVEDVPLRMIAREPRSNGYYITSCLISLLWSITPLSFTYLAYILCLSTNLSTPQTILGLFALTEVVFTLYQHYLIHTIQTPSPPSQLPLEARRKLFIDVLSADLIGGGGDEEGVPGQGVIDEAEAATQVNKAAYDLAQGGDLDGESEVRGMKEVRTAQSAVRYASRIHCKDGRPIRLKASDARAVQLRERLRTWFDHAPWSSLKRDNIRHWLAWSCFNVSLDTATNDPELSVFLDQTYDLLEARTGTIFPPGLNPSVRTIRLTLDPVRARPRPFILYVGTSSINAILLASYQWFYGMTRHTCPSGNIDYLLYMPSGWDADTAYGDAQTLPVLYLHGLGFGMIQNGIAITTLIRRLPDHPIIVPLSHHTSQAIFHARHLKPWRREDFARDIMDVCEMWGFWRNPAKPGSDSAGGKENAPGRGGLSVFSHSNGSVAHGWLLKDAPHLIRRSTFVDPVVFCLWEGDVCHSFVYRTPSTALTLLLHQFIATEIGIAHYIQRHFDWADNTLFLDDISPSHLHDSKSFRVFLAGTDIIVDAARVRRHFQRRGIQEGKGGGMSWDEEAGHGDALYGALLNKVVEYVGTGSVRE